MPAIPSGTVTFLFTDIEGSTALLKRLGNHFADVLADHRRVLRARFSDHGGQEIDTQGDAFFYAFPRARDAVAAAVDAQRALAAHEWPGDVEVRVRIGLHTGEPAVGDEGYTGLDVVRAARIGAVATGGQVLVSETTHALVGDDLPRGVTVLPLGRRRLKGIDRPEPVFALRIPELAADSPPVVGPIVTGSADVADRTRSTIEERVLAAVEQAAAGAETDQERRRNRTRITIAVLVLVGTVLVSALVILPIIAIFLERP